MKLSRQNALKEFTKATQAVQDYMVKFYGVNWFNQSPFTRNELQKFFLLDERLQTSSKTEVALAICPLLQYFITFNLIEANQDVCEATQMLLEAYEYGDTVVRSPVDSQGNNQSDTLNATVDRIRKQLMRAHAIADVEFFYMLKHFFPDGNPFDVLYDRLHEPFNAVAVG